MYSNASCDYINFLIASSLLLAVLKLRRGYLKIQTISKFGEQSKLTLLIDNVPIFL